MRITRFVMVAHPPAPAVSGRPVAARVAVAVVLTVALAACGTGGGSLGDPVTSGELTLTPIASGEFLTAMAVRPGDDRIFVTEKEGRLLAVDPDGRVEEVLDLTDEVIHEVEQGLLGVAFSPPGDAMYLTSVVVGNEYRLDEYPVLDGAPVRDARRTVLAFQSEDDTHYGGTVAFGPDGMLWLAVGDDQDRDRPGASSKNAQVLDNARGSIVRIDVSGGDPYAIPPDNPFVDGGGAPEIWSYGLRNPWGFGFDRDTGDLWIADVGSNAWEEVNVARAPDLGRGANYGWPFFEGLERFTSDGWIEEEPPPGLTDPVFVYPNRGPRDDPEEVAGCAVIGGDVYRGDRIPELTGSYLFADYCRARLGVLDAAAPEAGGRWIGPELDDMVTAIGQDGDGELYVLTQGGLLYRIDPP